MTKNGHKFLRFFKVFKSLTVMPSLNIISYCQMSLHLPKHKRPHEVFIGTSYTSNQVQRFDLIVVSVAQSSCSEATHNFCVFMPSVAVEIVSEIENENAVIHQRV